MGEHEAVAGESDLRSEVSRMQQLLEGLRQKVDRLEQTVQSLEVEIRGIVEEADLGGH